MYPKYCIVLLPKKKNNKLQKKKSLERAQAEAYITCYLLIEAGCLHWYW